jgi:hypothetical protein
MLREEKSILSDLTPQPRSERCHELPQASAISTQPARLRESQQVGVRDHGLAPGFGGPSAENQDPDERGRASRVTSARPFSHG